MKGKPVILVVDDQPQNIELLEAHLVLQGYEIIKAANGEEALEKLSGNQIDLILLDVQMPGLDGFEVTRRVRQDHAHRLLPIILVTALRETEDRVKGIEAGCDDFISKPVDKMELLARVRSLLKVKAYNDLMSNYRKELESEVIRRTEELKHAFESLEQDIAQRKLAEEVLRRTEENFRRSLDESPLGIRIVSVKGKTLYANQAFLGICGYDDIEELRSTPVKKRYTQASYAEYQLRKKKRMNGEDYFSEYEISIITKTGKIRHLQVFRKEILWDGQKQFQALYQDVTERKRAEEKLVETLGGLRTAIGGIIQVLSSITEKRDPYTAGHQLRVADLARAVGQEMGLPADRVEGLYLAAEIHDIGKVSIPAEILSKPTRLTKIEYNLIQLHAQVGHDILGNIDFSWPIAKMILQHHERINGSGYPNQLKGEEILLEARILAVSDVVEAMASFRPYRPALGIEAALEEIEKNKGVLYDPDTVTACLTLFREKAFAFK